jgi:raffinose/stachyose/melibiose transport system permease protein
MTTFDAASNSDTSQSFAGRKKGVRPSDVLFHVVMTLYAMLFFLPLLWMAMSSFKTNGQIFQSPFALPTSWDWSVFATAWADGGIGQYAINSFIVTAVSTVAILGLGSMAAFAFSRMKFRGSGLLLTLFTLGLLLPIQSYFIAQNSLFEYLHLKDTRWALIIPYTAFGLPLAIWLLKAYLDSLPKELFEAARIDGAGDFRIYWSVVLPLVRSGMATVAIFSALAAWNEFLLALLYIQNDELKTIPVGLLAFSTKYITDYHLLFAALTIVTIPMIVIYVLFHRRIAQGLTEGSLK